MPLKTQPARSPNPGQLKEATILGISDFHGQLVPLAEAADNITGPGTSNPTFSIGGSSFLKPWFDLYRAEAPRGSLTVAGGDSEGATPPISNFFGDKPTVEIMNMMGFASDGLGTHNFDRGQTYLRTQLIPLANFPFLSANVVVTLQVTGAELKTMLENGVSRMPAVDGRFPQVSGLCFTYDIAAPAGSRVTSAVMTDMSGSCTGPSVDQTSTTTTYKIAENDFMAAGGDGYPFFTPRVTTQNFLDEVLADYVTANSPVSPFVLTPPNGRINCADSNGATAPNCPVLVPSP